MHWWLAQHLAVTALLALFVAALCQWRRLGPATRHLLWLVVLIKLLAPPIYYWPWSFAEMKEAWFALVSQSAGSSAGAFHPEATAADSRAWMEPTDSPPAGQILISPSMSKVLSVPARTPEPSDELTIIQTSPSAPLPTSVAWTIVNNVNWEWLGLGIWIGGSGLVAAVELIRIARCMARLRRGLDAPQDLVVLVDITAAALEVRAPRIRIVQGFGSPMIWSLGRPLLLWPAEFADRFDTDQRRAIIAHELAHLRRRDHWVARVLLLAQVLWWWNPLLWWVRRELHRQAEWACDAWVVTTLPSQRQCYASTLIDVVGLVSHVPLPAPGLGIAGARAAFQRRLTMIMCQQVPCRASRWALLLIGLIAAATLPAWSYAQTPDVQEKVDAALALARMKDAVARLQMHKQQLEAELASLQKQLADLGYGQAANAMTAATRERLDQYNAALSLMQRVQAPVANLQQNPASARPLPNLPTSRRNMGAEKRPWGPEQATGAPDCPEGGDNGKAWASLTEDGQDEWLLLEYAEKIKPVAVLVYENYCPGSLNKISFFTSDGLEHEVWKGKDPTPVGSSMGVSVIPIRDGLTTGKIKLHLGSKAVPGWNEIDAVGLLDGQGRIHWATKAQASSTYADQGARTTTTTVQVGGKYVDFVNTVAPKSETQRLEQLEKDMQEIKQLLQKLTKQPGAMNDLELKHRDDRAAQLEAENQALRDQLEKWRRVGKDQAK